MFSLLLLSLLALSLSTPDDASLLPVCLTDEDCDDISQRAAADYRCFQYRCFPWDQQELQGGLRNCIKKEDCRKLRREEGGDGEDGECFRHQDVRTIHKGVCVSKKSSVQCSEPGDCGGGLVCINNYCGEQHYLEELKNLPCTDQQYCKDLFSVDHCCYDLSSEILDKKCCDGGVVVPQDISDKDTVNKINLDVGSLPHEEREEVCVSFPQDLLNTILNCDEFTSIVETTDETVNTSSPSSTSLPITTITSTQLVANNPAAEKIHTEEDMDDGTDDEEVSDDNDLPVIIVDMESRSGALQLTFSWIAVSVVLAIYY